MEAAFVLGVSMVTSGCHVRGEPASALEAVAGARVYWRGYGDRERLLLQRGESLTHSCFPHTFAVAKLSKSPMDAGGGVLGRCRPGRHSLLPAARQNKAGQAWGETHGCEAYNAPCILLAAFHGVTVWCGLCWSLGQLLPAAALPSASVSAAGGYLYAPLRQGHRPSRVPRGKPSLLLPLLRASSLLLSLSQRGLRHVLLIGLGMVMM